jgi:hypothetical protein
MDTYVLNVGIRSIDDSVRLEHGTWTDWDCGKMYMGGDVCFSPLSPCCAFISLLSQK